MRIEQGIRDTKDARWGFALRYARSRRAERLEVLLLLAALGTLAYWLAGLAGTAKQWARHFQVNTVRRRAVLSTVFVGRQLLASLRFRLRCADLRHARSTSCLLLSLAARPCNDFVGILQARASGGRTSLGRDGMTAAEFAAAQMAIGWTHDEVAAELGVTPAVVRGWAAGTVPVPRGYAQQLAWEAAIAGRRAALRASGLPECGWLNTHLEGMPEDAGGLERHQRATESHVANCEVCRARERYQAEHLGPLPPPPMPAWMYVFRWIDRVPRWARPAVVGAALPAGVVLVRALFSAPALLASPGGLVPTSSSSGSYRSCSDS